MIAALAANLQDASEPLLTVTHQAAVVICMQIN